MQIDHAMGIGGSHPATSQPVCSKLRRHPRNGRALDLDGDDKKAGNRRSPVRGPAPEKATQNPPKIREDFTMPTYVVLGNFTDQGIRNIKDSPKRREAVSAMAKKAGASLKETYWTLGQYDFVAIFEAPDDVCMTALGVSIGKLGNVRTQTLRAFPTAEMKSILGKLA
jgi:uncharacterized protein with GYD domain